ncbi:DUF815 domain-containing protein [Sandaracinobacteroides saxicola]|uniref:DUF815 domain-containing protein n=1 Tax=Sandaracinobacteroides saxicola TaxID=2759707 RepID=A0A7G5IM71_9SPHN|nr:DUF815 domain-containing protein [Sandaracinobacteroides saxicola]
MAAILGRIADALERLAPHPPAAIDPLAHAVLRWDGARLEAVEAAGALPLARFVGVDRQRDAMLANARALSRGGQAHDMLLWGARGMGKSALVRSVAAHVGVPLRLVELSAGDLRSLPALFAVLPAAGAWLVWVDDLVLGDGEARLLRSLLDGGTRARPGNVRLVVTSNHRHLLQRVASTEVRHARDEEDDQLALADRFGLTLGFHAAGQDEYLEMVRRHAEAAGKAWERGAALEFAATRGSRSGRTAWHYVVGLG